MNGSDMFIIKFYTDIVSDSKIEITLNLAAVKETSGNRNQ